MRSYLAVIPFLVAVTCVSCSSRTRVLHPTFPNGGMLKGSTPPDARGMLALEAMFVPSNRFGSSALTHASRQNLSLFGSQGFYAVMTAGCLADGRLVLEGHWRNPETTDTGLIRMFAGPKELVAALCTPEDAKGPRAELPKPTLDGATGSGNALPDVDLHLAFDRPRVDLRGRFLSAAHHGACPTVVDCGASENTVESIRMVESLGGLAVEIDVRMTSDGVPIVYHDDTFNPRLTTGTFCHGTVSDFTLAHLRYECKAKYGEEIPTLDDALRAIIDETDLRGVWIDLKVVEAVVPAIAAAQRWNAEAAAKGRQLRIVLGLAEQATYDVFVATPHEGVLCLAELEPEDVRRAGCDYWGPRWTRGTMASEVTALQAEGKNVVYWTIDDPDFLDKFIVEGHPNGILSNQPGFVMQRVQSLKIYPPEGRTK